MSYTFSTEQQAIIDSRHQNVLVSAAAGSGKTSVLTERIVGLVTDPDEPADIDRILVVTFTDAAAKEMKERISKSLNKKLSENPNDEHLQKQATLIHGAQISTIHSFCLNLMRNHLTKLDTDPAFRVAGAGETELIKEDVLKDVMKRAYASKDEDFYHTVDCYSKKDNDNLLEEIIMDIYGFAMSYPYPVDWLEGCRKDYEYSSLEEFKNSLLCRKIVDETEDKVGKIVEMVKETLDACLEPGGVEPYAKTIQKDYDMLSELHKNLKGKDYDEMVRLFSSVHFDRIANANGYDESSRDYIKNMRGAYKDAISDISKECFERTVEEYYNDIVSAKPVVSKVIDLVEDFMASFDKAKRARNIIDFSDMEHFAVKILIKEYRDDGTYDITDVAEDYRHFFKEVMVDEYQDVNLVQELIIKSVSGENTDGIHNRFMVGDVKQSIYRFRLARPEIFMGKTERYKKDPDSTHRLITLMRNYRSRQSVIDSVNAVFERVMTKELGGVVYDEDARLYKEGSYPDDEPYNTTEVVLVGTEENADTAREMEASEMVNIIQDTVTNRFVWDKDKSGMRKAEYRDIAILFRAPGKWRDTLKKVFGDSNIPYHIADSGDFYDTREIREVISFLNIVNNPLDDISLYASMTSVFGRMSDEECARVRGFDGGCGRFLYDRVISYSEAHPEDEKLSAFLSLLKRYRELSKILPIPELITRLFDETGYKHIVSAMPDGEKRLANVNMLVLKATEYAKTSFYGLFHFLRYIELIKKLEKEEGEANTFDENANVVKIMTIHKSKGLEFPVCIVAGIDESFNLDDLSEEFVTEIDAGIGVNFVDPVNRVKRSTLIRNRIIGKLRTEMIGEEVRVLYVAMTRAKEKLIMIGTCKKPDEWYDSESSAKFNSFLSLIKPAVTGATKNLFNYRSCYGADIMVESTAREVSGISRREELDNMGTVDEALFAQLKERFSFTYPHKALERLYTKTTVSNLKMAAIEREDDGSFKPFEENEPSEYIPLFAGGSVEVKGTDRGTAYHEVMQLADFVKVVDSADRNAALTEEFARIVSAGRMSGEDVAKVRKDRLRTFFDSELAREMADADRNGCLYKEQPFVIGVPASSVEEGFSEKETILVQGVIDAFFVRDGKVSVVDYKTDRVDSADELIKRYKKQLEYYGEAVSKLMGMPVDRLLIYSFALGGVFVVE